MKKGQCRSWHWPMNQPPIRLASLVLFLSRWAFALRRGGLFFRLGSRGAVGLLGCVLLWRTCSRSTLFRCALVGFRLRSWFTGGMRFRSWTRLLRLWCAFLRSTCPGSTFFRCALVSFWLGSWFAGRMRFRSRTRLLRLRCAFLGSLGSACPGSILFRGGLMRFWRRLAGRMRLGGRMRLRSWFAFRARRGFVSRAFFARGV
jgi:hypothetical protein